MPDHHFADVISAGKKCIAALAGVSEAHIIGKPSLAVSSSRRWPVRYGGS
jgi:hypothetical protein